MADVTQKNAIHTNGKSVNGSTKKEAHWKTPLIKPHWKTFAGGLVIGLLLCAGFFYALASHSKRISPSEAKNHIGEFAIVSGTVSEVHVTRKGTVLLDMDGNFPNEQFTAVWLAPNAPAAALQNFSGKSISVKGAVQAYQGRPEIILTSMNQISD